MYCRKSYPYQAICCLVWDKVLSCGDGVALVEIDGQPVCVDLDREINDVNGQLSQTRNINHWVILHRRLKDLVSIDPNRWRVGKDGRAVRTLNRNGQIPAQEGPSLPLSMSAMSEAWYSRTRLFRGKKEAFSTLPDPVWRGSEEIDKIILQSQPKIRTDYRRLRSSSMSLCVCGCGTYTVGFFALGHRQRVNAAMRMVDQGLITDDDLIPRLRRYYKLKKMYPQLQLMDWLRSKGGDRWKE